MSSQYVPTRVDLLRAVLIGEATVGLRRTEAYRTAPEHERRSIAVLAVDEALRRLGLAEVAP